MGCTALGRPSQRRREGQSCTRYVVRRNVQLLQEFKRLESDDETGIIALESELDAALCILDYRLSRTTDYNARTIYTY